MAVPKQTDPQFKLRLTPELKGLIEDSAKSNNRSLNAEILARLADSFLPMAERDEALAAAFADNERLYVERAKLFEMMNSQERTLQELIEVHRTNSIMVKALGDAILADGDRSEFLKVLAAGLTEIEISTTSEASAVVPKEPWED